MANVSNEDTITCGNIFLRLAQGAIKKVEIVILRGFLCMSHQLYKCISVKCPCSNNLECLSSLLL